MRSLCPPGSKFPPTRGLYMSRCLYSISSKLPLLWLLHNLLKLLHQSWLLHNRLRLLLHCMLRGNILSLSTTKSLTFSLPLKGLHASCTSSAYRFLASTPIYFHFPTITKFSRKRADFKSAISHPNSDSTDFFFF